MYVPADAGVAGARLTCGDLSCIVVPSTGPYIKLAMLPRLVLGYPSYTATAQPSSLSLPLAVTPQTTNLQVPGTAINMAAALQVTANAAHPIAYHRQHAPSDAMNTPLHGQETNATSSFHHCTGALDLQVGARLHSTQLTHITAECALSHQKHFHNGHFPNAGAFTSGSSPQLPRTYGGLKRKSCDDNGSDSGDSSGKLDSLTEDERELYSKKLHCKVCRVSLNAPAQAKQHYEGKTHAKRVKLHTEAQPEKKTTDQTDCPDTRTTPAPTKDINPEIYCKVCAVSFNSSKQAHQHYGGKNHAKKLRASRRLSGQRSSRNSRSSFRLMCVVCKVRVANKEELDKHIQQTGHSISDVLPPSDVPWTSLLTVQ